MWEIYIHADFNQDLWQPIGIGMGYHCILCAAILMLIFLINIKCTDSTTEKGLSFSGEIETYVSSANTTSVCDNNKGDPGKDELVDGKYLIIIL